MPERKLFRVWTFYTPRIVDGEEVEPRLSRISAYTMWAHSQWEGCRWYEIEAESGAMAKRTARSMRLNEELLRYGHQGGIGGSDA